MDQEWKDASIYSFRKEVNFGRRVSGFIYTDTLGPPLGPFVAVEEPLPVNMDPNWFDTMEPIQLWTPLCEAK